MLRGLLRASNTMLVACFFRLGRSRDPVIPLVDSFHQWDIQFKARNLGVDTTTPADTFRHSLFASLAEYDRERILEKTKAGQQVAAAQGKHLGNQQDGTPKTW